MGAMLPWLHNNPPDIFFTQTPPTSATPVASLPIMPVRLPCGYHVVNLRMLRVVKEESLKECLLILHRTATDCTFMARHQTCDMVGDPVLYIEFSPFKILCLGSIDLIGMNLVISDSWYKGRILQRNDRKMTIKWSENFYYGFLQRNDRKMTIYSMEFCRGIIVKMTIVTMEFCKGMIGK